MLIGDILNLKGGAVHGIEPSARLVAAVDRMVAHDIGSLVVMEGGAMVGLLTFREVLKALQARGGSLGEMQTHEAMVRDPVCAAPAQTLDELRVIMTRHHVRYLPVKDGEGLLGIVSFHDVAKALIRQTSMENRLLRRYIGKTPDPQAS